MKLPIVLFIILLFQVNLYSNCECNNCSYLIPTFGIGTSTLTVSGATNGSLGQNNQRLRAVHLNLAHNAIRHIELRLIAPNGSQVVLIQRIDGNTTSQGNQWDICFMDCIEPSSPDPGFSAVFDNTEPWGTFSNFAGAYYPSVGCLSDLTGNINGTWTLEFEDYVPNLSGFLNSWSLEFEDNTGTDCFNNCSSNPPNSCQANGGEFTPFTLNACEGDASLNLNIAINFPGNTPDPNLYDYYYVITDVNGVVLNILPNSDLTSFPPGTYNVCGLSVLASDFSLIPPPNGTLTISNIATDIGNDLYCAELSLNCWQIVIAPNDNIPTPIVTGPLEVCPGVPVTYTIDNYDPNYLFRVVQGGFAFFAFDDEINITFLSGPATICIQALTDCGESIDYCLTIEVLDPNVDILINGPIDVCQDVDYDYTLSPVLPVGASWSVNVIGGTLVSQSGNDLSIEWSANGGNNRILATLVGGPCGNIGPVELVVNLSDYTLPTTLNSLSPLCIGTTGQSSITANAQITNYIWSGTGIAILSGQGTAGPLSYTMDQTGTAQICLEVETTCGIVGPLCETITVLDFPMPMIDLINPTCDLELTLTGIIGSGSSASWQIISGPNGANILTPNNSTTNVQVNQSGTYVFQLTENNGSCSGTTTNSVEVLETPIIGSISYDCQGNSDDYVATINISGGQPPYMVNGVMATGNTYTFLPVTSGSNILVSIIDENGCQSETNITQVCPCISNAGTMSTQTINNCISSGVSVIGIHNGNATLDNNDIGVYILHTGNGTTLGTIIEINTTGIFAFQAGITQGVTYFISYVVGNEIIGDIDLSDNCLSVSIGQPVIFYEDPTINITSPNSFCPPTGFLDAVIGGSFTSLVWSQISGPNNATILNPNSMLANVSFPQSGTYEFEILVTNGPCSASETIEVDIISLPQITNIFETCNGANEYTLTFDINAPTIVSNISINGVLNGNTFTSAPLDPSIIYNIIISLSNGCNVTFNVGPVDCDCVNRSGTMSNDILSACITTGDVVEATYNNDGALQLGDIGLYYLHDNPGSSLGFVYDFNTTGEFPFLTGMIPGVTYYISYVVGQDMGGLIDLNDSCLKVSFGQPVVFFSDPILNYLYEMDVCGLTSEFTAIINPSIENVVWKFVSGPDLAIIDDEGSATTNVNITSQGQYTFEIEVSNLACSIAEQFIVNFIELPKIDSIKTQCLQSTIFELTFVVDGDVSLINVNIQGTFDDNRFTSESLSSDSMYIVIVTDNNGCSATFNLGPVNCNCLSTQGTMSLDTLKICETSGSITIGFNNDAVIFPGDTSIFVIHEGSLDSLINPIFVTDTTSFDIPGNIVRNQIFYVSHVVSPILNGNIDFQSECLRVSQGQPLIIYSTPEFIFPADIEVCLDNIAVPIENANNGTFDIISNTTGSNIGISYIGDSLFINPLIATELIISYVENNGTCLIKDTLSVIFNSLPLVSNIAAECTGDTFLASFEISDGVGPYLVNGIAITGNMYESASVVSETILSFTISDVNGCASETFDITTNCSCPGNVGSLSPNTLISLCAGEHIDLSDVNLVGYVEDPAQNLYYVLHDGEENNLGNIIVLTTQNTINWVATIETSRTYFITAVLSSGTISEINLNDPCIEISQGIPVVWNSGPTVTINGISEICFNDDLIIEIKSAGPFPFSIQLTNNRGTTLSTIEITQSDQRISLPIVVGETMWSIANVLSNCVSNFSGTFISRVTEPQNVTIHTSAPVCSNPLFGSVIDLNTLLGSSNIVGVWLYQGSEVVNGIFNFDGFAPNNYSFTFDTRGLENPCEGDVYNTSIEVIECLCPKVILSDSLALCSTESSYSLSELGNITIAGNWTILNPNNNPKVPNVIENNLLFDNNVNGIYQLIYTITDQVPDECEKEFVVILGIEGAKSAGRLVQESSAFCENLNEIVDLSTLIEGASVDGTWFGVNGILENIQIQVNALNIGINSYVYRVPAGELCPADEIEVKINIVPSPEYIIDKESPKCPEENFGNISIQPINDPNLTLFLNGNQVSDISLSMLPPGRYIIEVFNIEGCSGGEEFIQILPAPIFYTDIGEDILVTINSTVELVLESDIPDSLLLSISWEDDNGFFNKSDKSVLYLVEGPTEIRVIITTINGCVYERLLKINTRLPNIVMPNIFNPNGQGANRTFGPVGLSGDINVKEFSIYDRWGNLVHSQQNKNISDIDLFWDGKFNGMELQPGVYVYSLTIAQLSGDIQILKGDLTLVK
ncbi:MAG: gliding motility-associated C-terminal domain-containing protein [Saprospiraceae bacterium]|nr:gliding motility-associated C-terminal domain-containing protein [Saprospiraceae bacterium]